MCFLWIGALLPWTLWFFNGEVRFRDREGVLQKCGIVLEPLSLSLILAWQNLRCLHCPSYAKLASDPHFGFLWNHIYSHFVRRRNVTKLGIGRAPDVWARFLYPPFVAHICKIIWKGGLAFVAHQIGSPLRFLSLQWENVRQFLRPYVNFWREYLLFFFGQRGILYCVS